MSQIYVNRTKKKQHKITLKVSVNNYKKCQMSWQFLIVQTIFKKATFAPKATATGHPSMI